MNANALIEFWKEAKGANIHPEDAKFNLPSEFIRNLRPVPWAGPLSKARVFLLYLNPGFDSREVLYEQDNKKFKNALERNLLGHEPYMYLQEEFAGHPGFGWASKVFGRDITQSDLKRFCVLQLVPYHSKAGAVATKVAKTLPSSQAVRSFVHNSLLPRASRNEVGIVVARASKLWGIDASTDASSIVVYQGGECRGAHQTSRTRGGQLLRHRLSQ